MAGIAGEWEFRVQLCRDLERQPVEDPTVEWKEDEAPFQRVGVVRVQPQDSWHPDRVQAVDEEMRFSVWTGLAAHRPLGNVNRARNAPYRIRPSSASAQPAARSTSPARCADDG